MEMVIVMCIFDATVIGCLTCICNIGELTIHIWHPHPPQKKNCWPFTIGVLKNQIDQWECCQLCGYGCRRLKNDLMATLGSWATSAQTSAMSAIQYKVVQLSNNLLESTHLLNSSYVHASTRARTPVRFVLSYTSRAVCFNCSYAFCGADAHGQ